MKHAICNAHILRELTGIIENSQSGWGWRMKRLMLRIYVASDYGTGTVAHFASYEKRYEKILAAGKKKNHRRKENIQKETKTDKKGGIYWNE